MIFYFLFFFLIFPMEDVLEHVLSISSTMLPFWSVVINMARFLSVVCVVGTQKK